MSMIEMGSWMVVIGRVLAWFCLFGNGTGRAGRTGPDHVGYNIVVPVLSVVTSKLRS